MGDSLRVEEYVQDFLHFLVDPLADHAHVFGQVRGGMDWQGVVELVGHCGVRLEVFGQSADEEENC